MKQLLRTGVALVIALLGASAPAPAHHSLQSEYDIDQSITLKGTVTKVDWVNPHVYVYLDVKDDKGATATWALEATNQRAILNNGVKKEDVRPGDHIKVRCHLLRDGARGCLLGFITPMHGDAARGNGVEIEWD